MDIGIIIPARYTSNRFPGKPLIDLHGKSMIHRTWIQCTKALVKDKIFVATDSAIIAEHVSGFGGQVVLTSSDCLTGTDRVAQANKQIGLDLVVNVQGDEPIIDPNDIEIVINASKTSGSKVVNGMSKITEESQFWSSMIPKVVFSVDGKLLYMSRAPIPGNKYGRFEFGFKQICIYGFKKEHLDWFGSFKSKSPFELQEDIEILRFVENGYEVEMVEVAGNSLAVDLPEDADKVRQKIKKIETDKN